MKKIFAALLALATSAAFGATFSPISLLNPTGSSSGQAIVSSGTSSSPSWQSVVNSVVAGSGVAISGATGNVTVGIANNGVGLGQIAQQAANTVLANATGSTANVAAFSMPGCSSTSSALQWTSGTGFACNSSINAATLGGATFAAPGPIGSTTRSSGAFTTLSANGVATLSGGASVTGGTTTDTLSIATSGTAPTAALGNSSTTIASTAFVAHHSVCSDILDFGGDNTNTNDNASAWSSALSAAPSNNKCVYFPAGVYKFASGISWTGTGVQGVTIRGDGKNSTVLNFTCSACAGITATTVGGAITISDLDVTTSVATCTTNTGIALVLGAGPSVTTPLVSSAIRNVAVHGYNSYASTNGFVNGITVGNVSNINFINVDSVGCTPTSGYSTNGNGLVFNSTNSPIGNQYNILGGFFGYYSNGIVYNGYSQGLTVTGTNFLGNQIGINIPSGSHTNQLNVTNSQFGNAAAGIYDAAGNIYTMVSNSLFIQGLSTSEGIQLAQWYGLTATGNVFVGTGASAGHTEIGIHLTQRNGGSAIITGNEFEAMDAGIQLDSTAKFVNVQSNVYDMGTGATVTNSGGAACPATASGNCVGGGSQ